MRSAWDRYVSPAKNASFDLPLLAGIRTPFHHTSLALTFSSKLSMPSNSAAAAFTAAVCSGLRVGTELLRVCLPIIFSRPSLNRRIRNLLEVEESSLIRRATLGAPKPPGDTA